MANPFGDTPVAKNPFGDTPTRIDLNAPQPKAPATGMFTVGTFGTPPRATPPAPLPEPPPPPDFPLPPVEGYAQPTPKDVRKESLIEEAKKRPSLWKKIQYFVEPLASMATSAIATPVAGIAGIATLPFGVQTSEDVIKSIEGLAYKPSSEQGKEGMRDLGELLKPVGETYESVKTGIGDPILEKTGSPLLATTGYMAPDVLLSLLGLKGLKGVRSGTPLIDASGQPTITLKRALDRTGIVYENLAPEAKAAIPRVAEPTFLGGSGVAPSIEGAIVKQIQSGSRDGGLAKLTLDNGKVVYDNIADEAIKQGFREGQVQAIKTMNPATKQSANEMLEIMKKTKANERLSLDIRPTDVVGSAVEQRLDFLRNAADIAADELDYVVKHNLRGVPVDPTGVLTKLKSSFDKLKLDFLRDDAGAIVRNKSGMPTIRFEESLISKDRSAQKVIRDLVDLMGEGGAPDAARLHDLKRQIDIMVDYKKNTSTGLSNAGKNVLKDVRKSLNETLRGLDPQYAKANDVLHTVLTAVEGLDDAIGTVSITGVGANKAVGQKLRGLMSNNQGRVALENALDQVNAATRNLGGQTMTDIKDLVQFADTLDSHFGTMAKTGFAGQVEQAIDSASKSTTVAGAAKEGAKYLYNKARGINDFNSFNALEKLLRR
ncbi:MAG: hypothetical protein HGA87_00990 [Desulfobulbaceae bacterium]|nr:hypothetical protein [Desulfobulbaceae bacterium]